MPSLSADRYHRPVKQLPDSDQSLVVRTDFSDDATWAEVRTAFAAPVGDFQAFLEFVDDREYDGASTSQIVEMRPANEGMTFVFLADRETMMQSEHTALVLELRNKSART